MLRLGARTADQNAQGALASRHFLLCRQAALHSVAFQRKVTHVLGEPIEQICLTLQHRGDHSRIDNLCQQCGKQTADNSPNAAWSRAAVWTGALLKKL
jgi:hypothetical protein